MEGLYFLRNRMNSRFLKSAFSCGSFGNSRISNRRFHQSAFLHAAKDPYTVIGTSNPNKGVPKTASASEIKKKYYQLAKQYHPDTNKDPKAKEKFVEIQTAYDVLSDDKKRAQFDQYGSTEEQMNRQGHGSQGFGGFGGFGGQSGFGGNADMFNDFFGGGFGQRSGHTVGGDVRTSTTVSFMDAAHGTQKKVDFVNVSTCESCTGSGVKKGGQKSTCATCKGSGQVMSPKLRSCSIKAGSDWLQHVHNVTGQANPFREDRSVVTAMVLEK
jgi:molecular chaperone DnaJ